MYLTNVTKQHVQFVRMTNSAIKLWINLISVFKNQINAKKLKMIIKI